MSRVGPLVESVQSLRNMGAAVNYYEHQATGCIALSDAVLIARGGVAYRPLADAYFAERHILSAEEVS
jgi:hypothetical protein